MRRGFLKEICRVMRNTRKGCAFVSYRGSFNFTATQRRIMAKHKTISIWDPKIIRRALLDAIRKLNPIKMMGNPVMFVVEVGSVLTTILLIRNIMQGAGVGFELQI